MIARARLKLAAALALPVLGLGYGWATTHAMAQRGTAWDVQVAGYDPRDLLRGHYITYQYVWPGVADVMQLYGDDRLCLEGQAPHIDRASALKPDDPEHPARCTSVLRPSRETNTLHGGIYYVPQARATEYESKLRDPKLKATLRVRVREDGMIQPVELRFEPAPAP